MDDWADAILIANSLFVKRDALDVDSSFRKGLAFSTPHGEATHQSACARRARTRAARATSENANRSRADSRGRGLVAQRCHETFADDLRRLGLGFGTVLGCRSSGNQAEMDRQ